MSEEVTITLGEQTVNVTVEMGASGGGSGTVTSVALSAPTGFAVTGSPITTTGTLALAYASGYSLPTDAEQSAWDAAVSTLGSHTGAGGTAHANVIAAGAAGFMTGADKTKLDGIATGATANSADATLLARANHTGTQAAGTITGLASVATSGSAADLSTGTLPDARMPAMTGDATSSAGAVALTIANDAVSNAKLANVATSTIKGRVTSGTGDPEDLTAAQARTVLNVADGASANSSDATLLARANHTGTQAISTILAAATSRLFGRITASGGAGEELTGTQATTLLDTFTSVLKGLVPASGGGTTTFLRADGTFAAPTNVESYTIATADTANADATPNTYYDATGLSFAVVSGRTYEFEFLVRYTCAANTTGSKWSVNGPTFDTLVYEVDWPLHSTGNSRVNGNVTYDSTGYSANASTPTYGGFARITGHIKPNANGTVICRFASEVASSAITVKAGSRVRVIEVLTS